MIPLLCLRWWGHQRWLPFGVRDRVLRLLAKPEKLAGRRFSVPFFGLRYRGDLGSYLDWSVYFYGAYEYGLLTLMARVAELAGPEAIFMDVGANVGQHSLFMANRVAQVHAFEPWPAAHSQLQELMAYNNIRSVTAHAFALGDVNRNMPFHAPDSANLGTGSFCPGVNQNLPAGTLQVRRGDDVVVELGINRLDLIKIDTEGFELHVLNGLRDTLRRFAPVVVVEVAPASHAGSIDTAALFPDGWEVMTMSSHPERFDLSPSEKMGQRMVTLVAGPAEKLNRLCAGF